MGSRGGHTVNSEPTPPGWWLTNGKNITTQGCRIWAPHGASQPRGPAPRQPPRTSGFVKIAAQPPLSLRSFWISGPGLGLRMAFLTCSQVMPKLPAQVHTRGSASPNQGTWPACCLPNLAKPQLRTIWIQTYSSPLETKTPSLLFSEDSDFSNKGPGVTEQTTLEKSHLILML